MGQIIYTTVLFHLSGVYVTYLNIHVQRRTLLSKSNDEFILRWSINTSNSNAKGTKST